MVKQNSTGSETKSKLQLRKTITIGVVFFCLCTIVIILGDVKYQHYSKAKVFYDQANQFYENQEFEQAISTYQKAYEYSKKNRTEIILKMADSFVQLNHFEQAATILQDYYDSTNTVEVKKKMEQVIKIIINQQYDNSMERGVRFTQNNEYNRAIQEYQTAYRLKPDDAVALERVIQSFLACGDIEQAKEVLEEGKERFTKQTITALNKKINNTIVKQEYNELLAEADKFFCNKNYDQAYETYEKAIKLLPYEMDGYKQMSDKYITQGRYLDVIRIMKQYKRIYAFQGLDELLVEIQKQKEDKEVRTMILKKLYGAFESNSISEVNTIINDTSYAEYFAEGDTYYYSGFEKRIISKLPYKSGLIIYGDGYIYSGGLNNGKRSGHGNYYCPLKNKSGYVLYHGKFKNDLPNGKGELHTTMKLPFLEHQKVNVDVKGKFLNGLENGEMKRKIYLGDTYYGTLRYSASEGVPLPYTKNMNSVNGLGSYCIGDLRCKDGIIGIYYSLNDKRWGVPGI